MANGMQQSRNVTFVTWTLRHHPLCSEFQFISFSPYFRSLNFDLKETVLQLKFNPQCFQLVWENVYFMCSVDTKLVTIYSWSEWSHVMKSLRPEPWREKMAYLKTVAKYMYMLPNGAKWFIYLNLYLNFVFSLTDRQRDWHTAEWLKTWGSQGRGTGPQIRVPVPSPAFSINHQRTGNNLWTWPSNSPAPALSPGNQPLPPPQLNQMNP